MDNPEKIGNYDIFCIDRSLGLHSGSSGHAPVICAWCNEYQGPSPTAGWRDGDITHGMCDECGAKFVREELAKSLALDVAVSKSP